MSQLLDALRQLERRREPLLVPRPVVAPVKPKAARQATAPPVDLATVSTVIDVAAEGIAEALREESAAPPVELATDEFHRDAYREVCAQMLQAAPNARTLLTAQSESASFGSFSAATLAAAFAELGQGPVLLVARTELASVLSINLQPAATTTPGLQLVCAGSAALDQAALRDVDLWDTWREQFRYVLVDGGAADEVGRAAAACDATFLLVQLGRDSRPSARRAVESLHAAGARLLGTIVIGELD